MLVADASDGLEEELTTFVARGAELAMLAERLGGDERLVTLIGPAGSGKTRLAKEYAAESTALHDRRKFCDLSHARDGDDVLSQIAERFAVPLSERERTHIVERLGRAFAGHDRLLVILDNCEQVLGDVATFVTTWTRLAPRARFLATSRERLGLDFESVVRVEPLGIPDEASRLFAARAARVVDGFRLDPDNAPRVGEIVSRLGGLPLAIELAAAQLDVLGLDALLDRLQDPKLLKRAAHGGPERHAALSTALDWSWEMLSPIEQSALAQSAVFVGTFTIAALEDVLLPVADASTLDVVRKLAAKSLLRSGVGEDGERRFSHYPMIREYAASKLDDAKLRRDVERRHAEYYARLAGETAERAVSDAKALLQLSLELPNTLAAVRCLLDTDTSNELAARAILALRPYMTFTGTFPWCLELTRRVAARESDDSPLRARLLSLVGRLEALTGQAELGAETLRRAREALREGDAASRAEVEMACGFTSWLRGDAARAEPHYRAAAEFASEAGKTALRAECIAASATLRVWTGRPEGAVEELHAALDLAQTEPETLSSVLYFAGWVHSQLGHHAEAAHYLERAAVEGRQFRRMRMLAGSVDALGWLDLDQNEPELAESHFVQGVAWARETGDLYTQIHARAGNAIAKLLRGDLAIAESELDQVVSFSETLGNDRSTAQLLAYRAYAAALGGRHVEAEQLVLRASKLAQAIGDTLEQEVNLLAEAVGRLANKPVTPSATPSSETSLRVRFARRLRDRARHSERPASKHPNEPDLTIDAAGRWFEWRGGDRVDLERSAALAALLAALDAARHDSPEGRLTIEACFEALSPGERASIESKTNRVYVAMARLRKLGLRAALTGNRRGYRLRPDLAIVTAGGERIGKDS